MANVWMVHPILNNGDGVVPLEMHIMYVF